MEKRRDVACLKIRTRAFGKVKYALTKINRNTKYQVATAETGGRALKKEIP